MPTEAAAALTVRPLTPARWGDLEALFESRGCSVARNCWCMYYRVRGRDFFATSNARDRGLAKRALHALAASDPPPGLIGYRGRTPVGWISLGPREHYEKLAHSPAMKPVDDRAVWSVVCFVVPSQFRGQGVPAQLLEGAIAYAAKRGVHLLEAYPADPEVPGAPRSEWFGSKRMFEAAGFREVARHKPARPILRLEIAR